MFENLKAYLTQQGFKYIKPEKAGSLAEEMIALKTLGQSARAEFTEIAKVLALKVSPFEMMRVSNWANQAQVVRPHFWCYYKQPEDKIIRTMLDLPSGFMGIQLILVFQ